MWKYRYWVMHSANNAKTRTKVNLWSTANYRHILLANLQSLMSSQMKTTKLVFQHVLGERQVIFLLCSEKLNTKKDSDFVIHVGSNDTSTKFHKHKIIQNMSNIIDLEAQRPRLKMFTTWWSYYVKTNNAISLIIMILSVTEIEI